MPSNSQVNKAGRVLHRILRGEQVDPDAAAQASEVLSLFRVSHRVPLNSAVLHLRTTVTAADCPRAEIVQQIKR